jgi:hypothetical protein
LTAPPGALDALEAPETVVAAITAGIGGALTGVLAAAPDEAVELTRRLIGRQLVVAGERGPHVVTVLLDAGDTERALEFAADALIQELARDRPTLETWVWGHLVVSWHADSQRIGALVRLLAARAPGAATALLALLERIPTVDPSAIADARSAIVWALG